MNIVLIGPQGSGKGTQANLILADFPLIHIEMGALIREAAESHDKKGEIIDHLVNKKGSLLPDGVVLDMLITKFDQVGCDNLLFDGFPRTVSQYLSLKDLLGQRNSHLDLAIYIDISQEESLKRLKLRARQDDTPEAIKHRLESFHNMTEPILSLMAEDGILAKIDGSRSVETVYQDIKAQIH